MIRLPKLNDCDEYTTYSRFIIVHIVPKDIIIHTIIPYSYYPLILVNVGLPVFSSFHRSG